MDLPHSTSKSRRSPAGLVLALLSLGLITATPPHSSPSTEKTDTMDLPRSSNGPRRTGSQKQTRSVRNVKATTATVSRSECSLQATLARIWQGRQRRPVLALLARSLSFLQSSRSQPMISSTLVLVLSSLPLVDQFSGGATGHRPSH